MVKHRQLVPIVGPVSDDPPTNSTASPNHDGTLEKGTTLTFGSWSCMADGSGGFTNRLDDQRPEESDSPNQQLPQQLDSSSCRSAGFPEDFQKEENFDLINRYWADPDVPLTSYDYNLNPAAAASNMTYISPQQLLKRRSNRKRQQQVRNYRFAFANMYSP